MKKLRPLLLTVSVLAMAGCETTNSLFSSREPSETQFIQAGVTPETKIEVVEVPVPVAAPQLRKLPMQKAKKVEDPQKAIKNANKEALQQSTPDGFINAVQVYDYMPGALFEVWCAPGYVSTVALKPGEKLISASAGDTVRWVLGETVTGKNGQSQTLLLLKPVRPDIATNLIITTDQRVYLMEAKAIRGGVYNAAVTWNYPHDDFHEIKNSIHAKQLSEDQVIAGNVSVDDLNFDYDIETVSDHKDPKWKPVQAFDDGMKTYIRFPKSLGVSEAPPLFVRSGDGSTEIVNYRVKKNYYVIDRLVDIAELRLGEDPQMVVEIRRDGEASFWGIFASADHGKLNN